MRNLKKALALVVVFTMMLTLFAGISTASAASDYSSSVARMQKFGIMKGDGTGDLKPFADVTRAEFMTMLTRALGYEGAAEAAKGATKFADVPADHWASGYVNVAVQLGVTKGKSEDTFAPDDKVTVVEALAFIERAMGYEVLAKEKGGWPTGYLVVAKDRNYGLKLLDGVSEAATLPAPRGLIAKLFDNALNGPFYEIDSYSNGVPTYKQDAGVTFLTKMGYVQKKINGSDTFIVAATPYYGTDADKVKLLAEDKGGNLVEVKVKGYTAEELDQFMGKRVKAYYDDDDDDKLIDIQLADKDKTVVVAAKEISKDGNQIKIKDKDGTETKYDAKDGKIGAMVNWKFKIADNADIFAAGDLFGDEKDLIEATAVIFDGKVDFVYGFKYTKPGKVSGTVDNSVTGAKRIITSAGTYYIDKDKDNKAKYVEIVNNDKVVSLADVKDDQIVYVAAENDAKVEDNAKDNRVKVLVLTDTVVGELKAATLDGSNKATKVRIDSKTYDVYTPATLASWSVAFGDTVKARMTRDGKVFELVFEDGSVSKDYAIVLNAVVDINKYGEETFYIKLLKSDGTKTEYVADSAAKDTLEGMFKLTSMPGNTYPIKGSLVKYELNSDNKVIKLTVADNLTAKTVNDVDKRRLADKVAKEDAVLFNVEDAKLGSWTSINGTSYSKFSDGSDADASVINWDNLSNGNNVTQYILDDGYIVAANFTGASAGDKYAVIADKFAIKDGKNHLVLITKDGKVEYDSSVAISHNVGDFVTYTLNAEGKVATAATTGVTVTSSVYEIQDVTKNIIKVNDTPYSFADDVVVYYNKNLDPTEDFEALTKGDLYKYMEVKLYIKNGEVIAVAVSKK
jgi:hypothetical protein